MNEKALKNFNKDFRIVIAKNIKKFRKEQNVRLRNLAEILDVSPEY